MFQTYVVEKTKTHNYVSENHAVYEIIWKNIIDPDRPLMTIWHMRIACWISKATNKLSE